MSVIHFALAMVFIGFLMFVSYRGICGLMDILTSIRQVTTAADRLFACSHIDVLYWPTVMLGVYFLLNFAAVAYVVYIQVFGDTNFRKKYHNGKKRCYVVGVPDLLHGKTRILRSLFMMLIRGLLFSFSLTASLCVLGFLKPYLYKLISIIF